MPATMGVTHVPTRLGDPPVARKFALMVCIHIHLNIANANLLILF